MADEVEAQPEDSGISEEAFQNLADSPKSMRGDEGTIVERSAKDLIDMDRYLKGKEAANNGPPYGMRISQIVYPDTV